MADLHSANAENTAESDAPIGVDIVRGLDLFRSPQRPADAVGPEQHISMAGAEIHGHPDACCCHEPCVIPACHVPGAPGRQVSTPPGQGAPAPDLTDENDHTLADAEKRLRDWLMEHSEGGEMWMIVKGGFRRSYRVGQSDALRQAQAEWTSKYDETTRTHPKSVKVRAALRMAATLAGERADQISPHGSTGDAK